MPINIDGSKGIRQNTTEVTKIPVGTTAQRPANPELGMMRFNTDEGQVEGYNDRIDEWQPINQFFQQVVATGGTVTDIEQGGALFRVHTFTSDGAFEVTRGGEVEYLVVAGGGGGGDRPDAGSNRRAGGGGAGGLLSGVQTINPNAYSVIAGLGGSGAFAQDDGEDGEDSTVFGITAFGGGGGAEGGGNNPGRSGGSGGGACAGSSGELVPGGSGVEGQGNDGGDFPDPDSVRNCGAGGGGAGEKGGTPTSSGDGAPGGDGVANTITGTNVFYAGGGAGSDNGGLTEAGGIGGGGGGAPETSGEPNTGGGGSALSGNGGSGIVIVRYRIG